MQIRYTSEHARHDEGEAALASGRLLVCIPQSTPDDTAESAALAVRAALESGLAAVAQNIDDRYVGLSFVIET